MKQRNSAIEAARILFAMGVIVLHYNGNALVAVKRDSFNYFWLCLTTTICNGAVDFFFMISGYFLSRTDQRKLTKVILLYVQAVVFNLCFYMGSIMMGNEDCSIKGLFSRMIPEAWFVVMYCCIYIMSPYVNILIKNLDEKRLKRLIIAAFVLFSVVPYVSDVLTITWGDRFIMLNTIGTSGSSAGGTIVNALLMYMIGAFLCCGMIRIKKSVAVLMLIISEVITFMSSIIFEKGRDIVAWGYHSPFVIISVVLIVILLKDNCWENSAINELAKSTYTCFLFHGNFLAFIGIERVAVMRPQILLLHQFFAVITLFLLSYIVYKIYNSCMLWLVGFSTLIYKRITE